MAIPVLKATVFGNSLRTSALFVAWASMVLGVFTFSYYISELYKFSYFFESWYRNIYIYGNRDLDQDDISRMCRMRTERMAEAAMCIGGSLILMGISLLLLIGIHKRKPRCMIPAIFSSGLGLSLLAVATFHEAYSYRGIDREVFQSIVWGLIGYYLFLIVYSHFKEIEDANRSNVLSHQLLTNASIISNSAPVKPVDNNIA